MGQSFLFCSLAVGELFFLISTVQRWNLASVFAVKLFLQDFGDGGAFPEIHVAQFPLEMGRKKKTSNALAVQVDAEGKIKYDAIARQGQGKDKVTARILSAHY